MSWFDNLASRLSKKHIIAKPGFNRWLIAPASVAIHLCIGSVYAWSIFNPALTKQFGVVASAADDWGFYLLSGFFLPRLCFWD